MNTYSSQLEQLSRQGNLRSLPAVDAQGLSIVRDGNTMLNFSSNDYLGLADDTNLKEEFLQSLNPRDVRFSSTSSRLLTGNFPVYARRIVQSRSLSRIQQRLPCQQWYSAGSDRQSLFNFGRQTRPCEHSRRDRTLQSPLHTLPA